MSNHISVYFVYRRERVPDVMRAIGERSAGPVRRYGDGTAPHVSRDVTTWDDVPATGPFSAFYDWVLPLPSDLPHPHGDKLFDGEPMYEQAAELVFLTHLTAGAEYGILGLEGANNDFDAYLRWSPWAREWALGFARDTGALVAMEVHHDLWSPGGCGTGFRPLTAVGVGELRLLPEDEDPRRFTLDDRARALLA